jgi:hypothetical protein
MDVKKMALMALVLLALTMPTVLAGSDTLNVSVTVPTIPTPPSAVGLLILSPSGLLIGIVFGIGIILFMLKGYIDFDIGKVDEIVWVSIGAVILVTILFAIIFI